MVHGAILNPAPEVLAASAEVAVVSAASAAEASVVAELVGVGKRMKNFNNKYLFL